VTLAGVVVLLLIRLRCSTAPMRRMLAPVLVASILYAGSLALYLILHAHGTTVSGWVVIVMILIIPLALLVGLARERVFVHSAMDRLVTALSGFRSDDQVRAAVAAALEDEPLEILFWRAADGCYVDRHGVPARVPEAHESIMVTKLENAGEPIAAIVHDSVFAQESRLIRAITAAGMVGIEKTQLAADLQLSQRRLVRTADVTRERFERDLHDGAKEPRSPGVFQSDEQTGMARG
jgi:hypothetical protein